MNLWKHLTSRFTAKNTPDAQAPKDSVGRATRACSRASAADRQGSPATASTLQPSESANADSPRRSPAQRDEDGAVHPSTSIGDDGTSTLQPSNSSTLDNLGYNRNGKIARLPRELRDRINQALYNRCTAKDLARALNQMPEVKAVLAQYFDGRPLKTQNIYEWKQGGYRDWLHHREILEQQRELNADAQDMADSANGMADSLFGLVTLDYAHLMTKRDEHTPEEFDKRWKKLGLQSQDIIRLRRCHLNARRVDVQETRLERDHEKTDEQVFLKFVEWTENPEVRKALILEPMERRRRLRQIYEMPPTPEDILVEKETRHDPYFHPRGKNPTKCKPKPAEKTQSDAGSVNQPTDAKGGASGDASLPASRSDETSNVQKHEDAVGPRSCAAVGNEGEQKTEKSLAHDYAGKTTSQIIAEIEEKYAREKAARLNASRRTGVSPVSDPKSELAPASATASTLQPSNASTSAASPTRLPGASAWDSFSEPVHYSPSIYPSHHTAYNFKLTGG